MERTQAEVSQRRAMKRGASLGKVSFSTYLQTAKVVGQYCRHLNWGGPVKNHPEAVQLKTDPPCSFCLGVPTLVHAFLLEAPSRVRGRMAWVFLWAFTGKQYRRCGVHRERALDVKVQTHVETCLRMWVA